MIDSNLREYIEQLRRTNDRPTLETLLEGDNYIIHFFGDKEYIFNTIIQDIEDSSPLLQGRYLSGGAPVTDESDKTIIRKYFLYEPGVVNIQVAKFSSPDDPGHTLRGKKCSAFVSLHPYQKKQVAGMTSIQVMRDVAINFLEYAIKRGFTLRVGLYGPDINHDPDVHHIPGPKGLEQSDWYIKIIPVRKIIPLIDSESTPPSIFTPRTNDEEIAPFALRNATSIEQTIYSAFKRYEELLQVLKGRIVVELGPGKLAYGYRMAQAVGAKGYIGVEPYFRTELLIEIMQNNPRPLNDNPPCPIALEDQHATAFFHRLPSASIDAVMAFSMDDMVFKGNWGYITEVNKEIARILRPKGVLIKNKRTCLHPLEWDVTREGNNIISRPRGYNQTRVDDILGITIYTK